jgi:hypothetical protein
VDGRARAVNCFQAHRITERYMDLYYSVLNGEQYVPKNPCQAEAV